MRKLQDPRLLVPISLVLLLWGCDCVRTVEGTIIDRWSLQAIDSVEIRIRQENGTYSTIRVHSNAAGDFEFFDINGGFRKCPDVQLHFAKAGFVPLDRTFPHFSAGDTVFLEPEIRPF